MRTVARRRPEVVKTAGGVRPSDLLRLNVDGRARLDRRAYTDPALFDAEMEKVWAKSWVFVAHESQLPNPEDYLTTHIGNQPVLVTRNSEGKLRAFINACTHRGALLRREGRGNARMHSCPYHAWTFNADGVLRSVTGEAQGFYPPSFDKGELNLLPLSGIDVYRGFVFATLNPDAMPLADYLGDARTLMDLLLDQSESGWEVLKGQSSYTYQGNWKLQIENGIDSYHAPVVHANFTATMNRRRSSSSQGEKVGSMNVRHDRERMYGGFFDLGRGHQMTWRDWDNPESRFNYGDLPDLTRRLGETRARWAVARMRNLFIFPNLMIMDQMSTQLRIVQPLEVDRTKVVGLVFGPVGEAADKRRLRLRFYEDFFNASGMATPDDLEVFNLSQRGFGGMGTRWSDFSRGAASQVRGANRFAQELGIAPLVSGDWIQDEGQMVGVYRSLLEQLDSDSAEGY